MGPGEEMRQHQHRPGQGRDHRGQRRQAAQQVPGEQRRRRGEARRREDDDPTPPRDAVSRGQRHLAEPFGRNPARAGQAVRERVGDRQRRVGEHPPPGGDMEIGVGVLEQSGRRRKHPQQRGQSDNPWPRWDQPTPGDAGARAHRGRRSQRRLHSRPRSTAGRRDNPNAVRPEVSPACALTSSMKPTIRSGRMMTGMWVRRMRAPEALATRTATRSASIPQLG
jgi:hypothetical protein